MEQKSNKCMLYKKNGKCVCVCNELDYYLDAVKFDENINCSLRNKLPQLITNNIMILPVNIFQCVRILLSI